VGPSRQTRVAGGAITTTRLTSGDLSGGVILKNIAKKAMNLGGNNEDFAVLRISTPPRMRRSSKARLPPEPRWPCALIRPWRSRSCGGQPCLPPQHDDGPGAGRQPGGGDRQTAVRLPRPQHAGQRAGAAPSPWWLEFVAARPEPRSWWRSSQLPFAISAFGSWAPSGRFRCVAFRWELQDQAPAHRWAGSHEAGHLPATGKPAAPSSLTCCVAEPSPGEAL